MRAPARLFGPGRAVVQCVDCHAGGEPARVVLGGLPWSLPPAACPTAASKRAWVAAHGGAWTDALLREPRGYPCQNLDIVFSPPPDGGDTADTGTGADAAAAEETLQYVIVEHAGVLPLFSGHNTLCVATALLEFGVLRPRASTPPDAAGAVVHTFALEAPAGRVRLAARVTADGKAAAVSMRPGCAFVARRGAPVRIPDAAAARVRSLVGPAAAARLTDPATGALVVPVDIAFGGMFYAVVDVTVFWPGDEDGGAAADAASWMAARPMRLAPSQGGVLCEVGEIIKAAAREQFPTPHPTQPGYVGPDILAFRQATAADDALPCPDAAPAVGPPPVPVPFADDAAASPAASPPPPLHGRNAVVMSNCPLRWDDPATWTGMLDRSACGSGTCAVMAVLHDRGDLRIGQQFCHRSIIGTAFTGRLLGPFAGDDAAAMPAGAVAPEITGSAYVTQLCQVVVDPLDPLPGGTPLVGDIW